MPIVHANGIDLYYETRGTGEPVLLIHGLGSSTRDWSPQIDALSKQFTVVAFDVRGHGRSSKPRGRYTVPLFTEDTIALIRELSLGPVHVVGISMGGMIAFQLAVTAPELVRSLVIVNSGPAMLVRTFAERMMIVSRIAIVRLMGMRKMGDVLAARLLPKPEHDALRAAFIERWAGNDSRAYLSSLKALVNWSVADRLAGIGCPVLVLTADHDYTPVAAKEAYLRHLRHGELAVIPDTRHFMTVEAPEAVNAVLTAFLARHRNHVGTGGTLSR
jgi:3-oxoadipate enol-lactonase